MSRLTEEKIPGTSLNEFVRKFIIISNLVTIKLDIYLD